MEQEWTERGRAAAGNSPHGEDGVWIGIDVGASSLRAAVYIDEVGECFPIPNEYLKTLTPALVALGKNHCLVGEYANRQDAHDADFFFDLKRAIGGKCADAMGENDDLASLSFTEESSGFLAISPQSGRRVPVEVLLSLLLSRIKRDAENFLETRAEAEVVTVKAAVITVPKYYTPTHKSAINSAAKHAGLQVSFKEDLIAAATAFCFDYRRGSTDAVAERAVLFDLGDSHLDVAWADIRGSNVEVVQTFASDMTKGGRVFEGRIRAGVDARCRKKRCLSGWQLKRKYREIKEQLSSDETAQVDVCFGPSGHGTRFPHLTRKEFELWCKDDFNACENILREAFDEARRTCAGSRKVTVLVAAGRSCRIPCVRAMLNSVGRYENCAVIYLGDDDIARGAAILTPGARASVNEGGGGGLDMGQEHYVDHFSSLGDCDTPPPIHPEKKGHWYKKGSITGLIKSVRRGSRGGPEPVQKQGGHGGRPEAGERNKANSSTPHDRQGEEGSDKAQLPPHKEDMGAPLSRAYPPPPPAPGISAACADEPDLLELNAFSTLKAVIDRQDLISELLLGLNGWRTLAAIDPAGRSSELLLRLQAVIDQADRASELLRLVKKLAWLFMCSSQTARRSRSLKAEYYEDLKKRVGRLLPEECASQRRPYLLVDCWDCDSKTQFALLANDRMTLYDDGTDLVLKRLVDENLCEFVVAPHFLFLAETMEKRAQIVHKFQKIKLCAQNFRVSDASASGEEVKESSSHLESMTGVAKEEKEAEEGKDVDADCLNKNGFQYVIVGKRQRRDLDCPEEVGRKVSVALRKGLNVIACVADISGIRGCREQLEIIRSAVESAAKVGQAVGRRTYWKDNLVIAYEPVWTKREEYTTSTSLPRLPRSERTTYLRLMVSFIRSWIATEVSFEAAQTTRIVYAGSRVDKMHDSVAREIPSLDGLLLEGEDGPDEPYVRGWVQTARLIQTAVQERARVAG
ncbi:hypothetical protein CBR_g17134 [Chara braunii]|uniref:Uncharacterized protein n=1 Tax=Chara braunii TaxID=69332 RepID=A0A388KUQ3_CHABU|nr:hypothetical protein CBR_g17134 [Chara braunii]|eukprot:GBG73795.1 hypothetical protein CBR_g17134 [Chara braunii]